MRYCLKRLDHGRATLDVGLNSVARFLRDPRGVTAVEYGLIVGAISAAIIGVVFLIGDDIAAMFQQIADVMNARLPSG